MTPAELFEKFGRPDCVVDTDTGDVSVCIGSVVVITVPGLYESREAICRKASRAHLRSVDTDPPVKP